MSLSWDSLHHKAKSLEARLEVRFLAIMHSPLYHKNLTFCVLFYLETCTKLFEYCSKNKRQFSV